MRVVMGMIVKNRFDELKRNLYHNSQFFDEVVIVSDSSEQDMNNWLLSEEARSLKVRAILDFDGYQTIRLRQRYLDAVEKTGWMMRLDVDEYISYEGGYQIREIAKEADAHNVNIVGFKACDIIENLDGTVHIGKPDWWCPNLFKLTPNIKYQGKHHEGIDLGVPHRQANVPFEYYHIRSRASQFLRGCRNAFAVAETASGVGSHEAWRDFRERCSAEGIEDFASLEKLLRSATVPTSLTDWFIEHRNSDNSEFRSWFVVYYCLLHPHLNKGYTNEEFPEFDPDRKPYPREMTF